MLQARRSCAQLRQPAAAVVEGLLAADGLLPGPQPWLTFQEATRLTSRPARPSPQSDALQAACRYLGNLLHTVSHLPARLEQLEVEAAGSGGPCWTPRQGMQLARALLASRCSRGLRSLVLQEPIPPAAAEALLQGLTALLGAELALHPANASSSGSDSSSDSGSAGEGSQRRRQQQDRAAQPVGSPVPGLPCTRAWRPSVDLPSLERLALHLPRGLQLDMACLASATSLTELVLVDCPKPLHWSCVSALTSLTGLALRQSSPPIRDGVRHLGCLAALQQLQSLELVGASCSAEDWRVLAALPQLQYLQLHEVVVSEQQRPCSITSMQVTGGIELELPEALLPGCLARQLPRLQELVVWAEGLEQLAEALQGHPALQTLLHNCMQAAPPEVAWRRQLLRQLPALQELTLFESRLQPCQLLADLAGCTGLQALYIEAPDEWDPQLAPQGPGPLAALAASAAAASLRSVHVGPSACAFAPGEVAALLQGGLPLLERVHLAVLVPGELADEQQVERLLPALLAWHGLSLPEGAALQCHEVARRDGAGLVAAVTLQLAR